MVTIPGNVVERELIFGIFASEGSEVEKSVSAGSALLFTFALANNPVIQHSVLNVCLEGGKSK